MIHRKIEACLQIGSLKLSEKKPSDDLLFGDVSKISSTGVSSSGINPKENNLKNQPNTIKETKTEVINTKHSEPTQSEEPEEGEVSGPIEEPVDIESP